MKKGILLSILALGLVLGLAVPMATPAVIEAQTNPPGCLNNCFSLDILKDKAVVHNHEYITYKVCAANNNGTCVSPCNMKGVTISLTLPASDGTATGTVVVLQASPGMDFPANGSADRCYNATEFPQLHFYVDVNPGVTSIKARVDYSGRLMDGPPAGDPSGSFKTLSVSVALGEKPPPPVGWETYPVDKLRVLLPWLALLAAIMVGAGLLVLRRRRTQA